MKRKLFALGILATTLTTTTAYAASAAQTPPNSEATTNVTYKSGYTGPTGPISPTDPDNDQNNWMVRYPKEINLTEQNKLSNSSSAYDGTESSNTYKSEFNTVKAKALQFEVVRQIKGNDGQIVVNDSNVGAGGIKVTVNSDTWKANEKAIEMNGLNATKVLMAIGSNNSNTENVTDKSQTELVAQNGEVTRLKAGQTLKNGYAVIVNSENEKNGQEYKAVVKFKFERQADAS